MKPRLLRLVSILGICGLAAGGFLLLRARSFAKIELSAYPTPTEGIQLAKVSTAMSEGGSAAPEWFDVKPGKLRLRKGAYLFKIGKKEGFVAIDVNGPVVLK